MWEDKEWRRENVRFSNVLLTRKWLRRWTSRGLSEYYLCSGILMRMTEFISVSTMRRVKKKEREKKKEKRLHSLISLLDKRICSIMSCLWDLQKELEIVLLKKTDSLIWNAAHWAFYRYDVVARIWVLVIWLFFGATVLHKIAMIQQIISGNNKKNWTRADLVTT